MKRARGFVDLVFDIVEETTNLVERTHDAVVERTVRRFAPIEPAKTTATVVTGIQTAISSITFESIRIVNGISRVAVNAAADVAEARLLDDGQAPELATPVRSTALGTPGWYVDFAQASLNGFWGDYIAKKNGRLDLGMTLRHHGRPLSVTRESLADAFPNPTPKVCVFVHGLASTEWLWSLSSEAYYGNPEVTFGTRLLEDAGFTPVYVRYNSGLHISENGKRLAALLEELLDAYPVPIDEIALVGHSMGGLVSRSAAHYGSQHDARWVKRLRHVACIGSPHLGAPLEKAVHLLTGALNRIDAAGAQVPAELLKARSVGVKDLRFGYTLDEEWLGKDLDAVFAGARKNVPLVDGVGYYFVAATITKDPAHPFGHLFGDLLVRMPSAAGAAPEPARRIHFDGGALVRGLNHVNIASHPAVYDALRGLLAA
jgi:pimeloyl-ACP methyl ester carboxylesterase